MKKIFLTGERPTGNLHIGHLFGTIKNRLKIQKKYKIFIIIADNQLNKIEKKEKKKNIKKLIIDYLTVGISFKKSCIFLQSEIKELLELEYFLTNFIDINTLKRNPSTKNVIVKKKNILCRDFLYPVSQASDILLFNANFIPVGKDQIPMLEITNKIVRNVNNFYKKKIFRKCKAILSKNKNVIGTDGKNKMSKSFKNAIFLNCNKEKLEKIILSLKTDHEKKTIYSPGNYKNSLVFNYLKIFLDKKKYTKIKKMYKLGSISDMETKKILFNKAWKKINYFNKKRKNIVKKINTDYIIKKNNRKAKKIAKKRIEIIKRSTSNFF